MARRIHGGISVTPRPSGGAVVTIKSATGEAFEIERSANQIAALIEELAAIKSPEAPAEPAEEAAKPKARSKKNA